MNEEETKTSLKEKRGRPVRRLLAALLGALVLSLPLEEILLAATPAATPARTERDSDDLPHLTWSDFFGKVESTGATFSDRMKELGGKRVVIRGYSVADPRPAGGLYLTRFPEGKLHPDDEDTLRWDSIGVVWRKGAKLPAIPKQPSVEGTLRLGNRDLGTETVILVLEDAVPHVEGAPKPAATTARPSGGAAPR